MSSTSTLKERSFQTDPEDDAETPFEAFSDIKSVLLRFCELLNKPPEKCLLWDPFYCAGTMKTHLLELGFPNVHNEAEDAFQVIAEGREPSFDILCSNPPFSGDNIERILEYCLNCGKPWLLLIPQYVAKKSYFLESIKQKHPDDHPFFVGPRHEPYQFSTPPRSEMSGDLTQVHRAGKFQTIWFVTPFPKTKSSWLLWWETQPTEITSKTCLSATTQGLPQLQFVKPKTPAQRRWAKKIRQQTISLQNNLDSKRQRFT